MAHSSGLRLCVEVRFLSRRYHGEVWPPAPATLFQALAVGGGVLGCRRLRETDVFDTLGWLDGLDAPEIVAPKPLSDGVSYRFPTLSNARDKLIKGALSRRRRKEGGSECREVLGILARKNGDMKMVRARILPEGATVRYLWRLPEGAEAEVMATKVRQMARCLVTLGWGIDPVAGDCRVLRSEESRFSGSVRYLPHSGTALSGGEWLNVPFPNAAKELKAVVQEWRNNIVEVTKVVGRGKRAKLETHLQVTYRTQPEIEGWSEQLYRPENVEPPRYESVVFRLEPVDDGTVKPIFFWEESSVVAAMMRHTAGKWFAEQHWDNKWVDPEKRVSAYVMGHFNGQGKPKVNGLPRLAYVPLPSIGHPHSDGWIRRVLFAVPVPGSGDAQVAAAALGLVDAMGGLLLHPQPGAGNYAEAMLADRREDDRVLLRYLPKQGARTWETVTPVILHGHTHVRGRFSQKRAEERLLEAFEAAGYPREMIEDLQLSQAPFWAGAKSAFQMRTPAKLASWPRIHVSVTFARPVYGPVLVGIGRHCGIGVFAVR